MSRRSSSGKQYTSAAHPSVTATVARRPNAGEDGFEYVVTLAAPGRSPERHVIFRDTTQFLSHAVWHEDAGRAQGSDESMLGFTKDEAVQELMRRYARAFT